MSDVLDVITAEIASILSGIVEGDKVCNDLFANLDKDAVDIENDKTYQNDC